MDLLFGLIGVLGFIVVVVKLIVHLDIDKKGRDK